MLFERALMRTCRAPCAKDGQLNPVPSVHHRKRLAGAQQAARMVIGSPRGREIG
jgi:hypothetical protein